MKDKGHYPNVPINICSGSVFLPLKREDNFSILDKMLPQRVRYNNEALKCKPSAHIRRLMYTVCHHVAK